jgi:hypothetical protein
MRVLHITLAKHRNKSKKGKTAKSPRSQFMTELMRLLTKNDPDATSEAFVNKDLETFIAKFKPVYEGMLALATPPVDEKDQTSVTATVHRHTMLKKS